MNRERKKKSKKQKEKRKKEKAMVKEGVKVRRKKIGKKE